MANKHVTHQRFSRHAYSLKKHVWGMYVSMANDLFQLFLEPSRFSGLVSYVLLLFNKSDEFCRYVKYKYKHVELYANTWTLSLCETILVIEAIWCEIQLDGLHVITANCVTHTRDSHVIGANPKWAINQRTGAVKEDKNGKTDDKGKSLIFVCYLSIAIQQYAHVEPGKNQCCCDMGCHLVEGHLLKKVCALSQLIWNWMKPRKLQIIWPMKRLISPHHLQRWTIGWHNDPKPNVMLVTWAADNTYATISQSGQAIMMPSILIEIMSFLSDMYDTPIRSVKLRTYLKLRSWIKL